MWPPATRSGTRPPRNSTITCRSSTCGRPAASTPSTSSATAGPARRSVGLDGGPIVRYIRWVGLGPILGPFIGGSDATGILEGNFGFSIKTGLNITDLVGPRIGPTLLLMGTGLIFAMLIGIPLGVIAAVRPYTRL